MLKLFTTSLLGLTVLSQTGPRQQIRELENIVSFHVQNELPTNQECSSCLITSCDETIELPPTMTCMVMNDKILNLRDSLFKASSQCKDKGSEYICTVVLAPIEQMLDRVCNHESISVVDLDGMREASFCEAHEKCDDLVRCSSITENIDCEYDINILSQLKTPNSYDTDVCESDDNVGEKLGNFFEDLLPSILAALSTNLLLIILIFSMLGCYMKCCRKKRNDNQNDVEIV